MDTLFLTNEARTYNRAKTASFNKGCYGKWTANFIG